MIVEVLNVGDGACCVVRQHPARDDGESTIIDCGAWRENGSRPARIAADSLGLGLGHVTSIVVTHFDADHWYGLRELAPLFAQARTEAGLSGRADVQLIYPQMPEVARDLPAATLAFITTIGGTGVRAMELSNAWAAVANIKRRALSQSHPFEASGRTWNVLWPPPELRPASAKSITRTLEDVRKLAEDLAAHGYPTLQRNLEEAYRERVFTPSPDENDSVPSDRSGPLGPDKGDDVMGDATDEPPPISAHTLDDADATLLPEEFRERFRAVARRIGRANNYLSLVFESETRELLVLGDIEGPALKAVTHHLAPRYGMILAPHHGTSALPAGFPRADLCVAQAGPLHFRRWHRHQASHRPTFAETCESTHRTGNIWWPVEAPWCCGWCMPDPY